ncbi:discoidin domain-containing protein [Dickeya zeae]|uniref:discoidin domain-containing protein n=1 Tax=Dickeya zeae TaxID=204042 RepID=UPI00143FE74F|nr:discoidin domain-containing protein [Dickeya zeae]QIZ46826.1 discoidin domain-containing protein [Dickeya zeae]
MWYKLGSLSLFSGSKVVLGNNTLWADKNNGVIAGGMLLIFADCSIKIYEIASVVSDTELMLASEYSGCTANGVHYAIPVFGSNDTFDHAAYVAQIAAMLAGYQSQLTQWKQVLTEHGQVTLTDNSGQSVVVKTLPDLTDAVSRMMDKTLNGADIPDKAQFVANLGLSDVVHKSDLANHTHTASQITDFTDAVRKVLVATLAAGQGVSLNYDTTNNQLVVSATGSNSGGGNNGGRGYTVVTRSGATANQVFTFPFSATGSMDYSFEAFALKEEAAAASPVVVNSFDNGTGMIATDGLVFNGVMKPYTGGDTTLTMNANGIYEAIIPEIQIGDIQVSAYTSIIPVLTSNTSASGITVSATSTNEINYPWKAFDGNASTYWQNYGGPSGLIVAFSVGTTVSGYYLDAALAGPPMGTGFWDFQGSDDGSTWTTLDSGSGNRITVTKSLPQPVSYRYYRLYIPGSGGFVYEMKILNNVQRVLIQASDDKYYTVTNGELTQIPLPSSIADISATGFTTSGKITNVIVKKLLSNQGGKLNVIVSPAPQIAKTASLKNIKSYSLLSTVTATVTQTGAGAVKMAVSRDGNEWFTWNGSAFISIGTLTIDRNGADKLNTQGVSVSALNALTSTQWALLYANTQGVPDNIAFAFGFSVPNGATDDAQVDQIILSAVSSAWKKQTEAEVEIRWYPDKVTFKTVAAGNYKLAYQQP